MAPIASDFISSQQEGGVKIYFIYDGSQRMVTVYTAAADARPGQSCHRTDYLYVGATTLVQAMKETADVWNAAWDF